MLKTEAENLEKEFETYKSRTVIMHPSLRMVLILTAIACTSYGWPLAAFSDTPDWQDLPAVKALQAAPPGSAEQQAAAQRLCHQTQGPSSQARWLPDGSLVCTLPPITSSQKSNV